MRKLITITILVLMTVFSLSAEEILKTRYVNNINEGTAAICLMSVDDSTGTLYFVAWYEVDGSDVINIYKCNSIEHAFNVWNMSRYEIESIRQFVEESVEDADGTLYLIKGYELKDNK